MTTLCCEAADLILCNQQKEPGPDQMTVEIQTLQHIQQQRRASASSPLPNSEITSKLWSLQATETNWKKQFLCRTTAEQSMVRMVE